LSHGPTVTQCDEDGDNKAGINDCHGAQQPEWRRVRDGALYIAEINRILRIDNVEANLGQPAAPVVVTDAYPADFHHGWKFIGFGPDGRLYVPVGANCNTCEPAAEYSMISSIKPDGSDKQVFAAVSATRSVRPGARDPGIWFTDNGRDSGQRPPA
jgi:glucose/arabinose dehydrogenase